MMGLGMVIYPWCVKLNITSFILVSCFTRIVAGVALQSMRLVYLKRTSYAR